MKILAAFLPLLLVVCCCLLEANAKRSRQGKRKGVGLRERKAKLREHADGTIDFPRDLEYTIDLEGESSRDLNLVFNPYMQMPGKNAARKRKYAFYTDVNTGESFACKVKRKNGKVKCDVAGITERNNETCYIPPNSKTAVCESSDGFSEGTLLAVDDDTKPIDSASVKLSSGKRQRRSGLPEPGFKVVEIAFVVDEAFMIPFYNRNPDNDGAAEEEAELYVTLLANEMSVYYRSVKVVSSGQLDLVIYPIDFIHPGKGNNFAWSENNRRNSDELDINNGLRDFFDYAYKSLNVNFDHAMAITGLNLYASGSGTGLLGVAYSRTLCRPNAPAVSMQENYGYNLGWIASHELGHSLGYIHDQSDQCPAGRNVMSSYLFNPSSTTKDTYFTFSSCSVDGFISHLNRYPDCTASNGFTDAQFLESFCSGLLGAQDISLDRQCQIRTGSSTASACSTRVSATSCYQGYTAYCRSSPSSSCSESLRFVWNGTPCGTSAGSMCYQGNCVADINVCPAVTASTQASTSNTQTPTATSQSTELPTVTSTTQASTSNTQTPTATSQSTELPTVTSSTSTLTSTTQASTSNTQTPTATSQSTELPTVTSTTSTLTSTTSTLTSTQASCSCCETSRRERKRCCKRGYAAGNTCQCCKPCSCCGERNSRKQRRCCRKYGSNCSCCS